MDKEMPADVREDVAKVEASFSDVCKCGHSIPDDHYHGECEIEDCACEGLPDLATELEQRVGQAVHLVAIVREQAAELGDIRAKRHSVIDGMTRAIAAEGDANKAYYAILAERDALRERLAKLETASGALVSAIYEGEDGRSASIVRRPCDSKSCKGLVCGPIEEFWRTVSEFQAVLAESKVPR